MRAEVQDDVNLLAAGLQGAIDRNIQLVRGLVAVVSFEPGIDQERFARLGDQVLRGASEVRHIAAAPDLVIRMLYPVEGNEAVLGMDYRDHPNQVATALLARDLNVTVVAGPTDLVQGGRAFLARSPVFVDAGPDRESRFWGIISTVIDPDRLYAAAGLDAARLGIDLVLTGRDGAAGGAPFYGDPAILDQEPVAARGGAALRRLGDRGGSRAAAGSAPPAPGASGAVLRARGAAGRRADHRRRPRWPTRASASWR